jgi:hypothetical protein
MEVSYRTDLAFNEWPSGIRDPIDVEVINVVDEDRAQPKDEEQDHAQENVEAVRERKKVEGLIKEGPHADHKNKMETSWGS